MIVMRVNMNGAPEHVKNPSKGERWFADLWKSSARSEAESFDKKFNVEEVTGFGGEAGKLWKAYFASYWAGEKFRNKDVPQGLIDVGVKVPIIGGLYRFVRNSVNGGDVAWAELRDEAEEKSKKYVAWLEMELIKQTVGLLAKEDPNLESVINDEDYLSALIDRLKGKDKFDAVYQAGIKVYGSPSAIQRSANLLSTIYSQDPKSVDPSMKERLLKAGKRFSPAGIEESEN